MTVKRQMMMLGNLSCPSCAAKLEKAVQKLSGVKSAKVSFGAGTLTVEYDEALLKDEEIKDKVEQFGVGVLG